MVALRERDRSGEGQVVDVNLLESMLQMMSALPSAAAHLGYEQPRLGSGIPYSVPRGTYRCADGKWVAISTSAESVAHRVLTLLGSATTRASRRSSRAPGTARSSTASSARGSARARRAEVLAAFDDGARPRSRPCTRCASCWPIRTCMARDVFVEVDGVVMQGPVARLVAHAGRGAVRRPGARRRHRRRARRARVARVTEAGFVLVGEPVHRSVRVDRGRRRSCAAAGIARRGARRRRADSTPPLVAGRPQRRGSAPARDVANGLGRCGTSGVRATRCCRIPAGAGRRPCPRTFVGDSTAQAVDGRLPPWPRMVG